MPQIAQVDARIPIELVVLITSHFHPPDLTIQPWSMPPEPGSDSWSLLVCSRVCHQWRAVVLPRLFFSLTVNFQREPRNGEAAADYLYGLKRRYKTISLLCEFLETMPGVGGYIRQLKLVGRSPRDPSADDQQLTARLFSRLLALCPNLAVLHLLGVFLRDVDMPDAASQRTLRVLKILPCTRGAGQQLQTPSHAHNADVAPLVFFSSILHLHLSTLPHVQQGLPSGTALKPLTVPHLTLERTGCGVMLFSDFLRMSGAVRTVTRLTTVGLFKPQTYLQTQMPFNPVCPELQRFLALVGPALEDVKVRQICSRRGEAALIPRLDVCGHLHRLRVGFDLTQGGGYALGVADAVTVLLRSVPTHAPLKQLDVDVVLPRTLFNAPQMVYTPSEVVRAALDAVDEALEWVLGWHATLPCVSVACSVPVHELYGVPDVAGLFPRVHAAGKLHVERTVE